MIWSNKTSTPPLTEVFRPSNVNSLCLLRTIGFNTAPDPFPPDILIDNTFSMSKNCGSTNTSFNDPFMTGCMSAVVPDPAWGITIFGKFITSKFVPLFKIFTFDNGPKNILSSDL